MIRRGGPRRWKNVHVTYDVPIEDLIDVDNSAAAGPQPTGFALLGQAARELDALAAEAAEQGKRLRALGSGWALTDIAVTDHWLVNTKLLNGCFDISSRYFEPTFEESRRPYVVLAQCGISVGELNVHLEVTATSGFRRSLKTAGIGAGQTIVGAISGNTHGSAINFGAMSDFVVGLQIVTGSGQSLWIERSSQPVLNDAFAEKLGAKRIRDDDVFNAAVVSFGAFGIVTAVAIETDPIYHLKFRPVREMSLRELKSRLDALDAGETDTWHHFEFVFDPWGERAMEAVAVRAPWEPGHATPTPVWIVRSEAGFAPGDQTPSLALRLPFLTPKMKTKAQFKAYRQRAILDDVRGSPGQLFTATITYLEGYTESAIGVRLQDASRMIDISSAVIRDLKLPAMSQVRAVHASQALLGFTSLEPKTAVFEFGLLLDDSFPEFERRVTAGLKAAGLPYTLHWSKNAGIDHDRLLEMYGADRVERWRLARRRVFEGDEARMRVFENDHLRRARLV